MKVLYSELLPSELRDRIANQPIAYLPLGVLEYHGEHMPLGADIIQADGLMLECAKRFGGVVLPSLYIGPGELAATKEHAFSDCYYVPGDFFQLLVDFVLTNLAMIGFRAVFAHGHGPSYLNWVKYMSEREKQFGMKLFGVTRDIRRSWKVQVDHAGRKETSLVQLLRPELVDLGKLSPDRSVWPTGVTGKDPRDATPEYGKICLEASLNIVERMLVESGFLWV